MEQQKPRLSILWHSVSPFCACYDEGTEVLAIDGWKKIKDIEVGEEVATLKPNTHELEFQKVVRKFEYDYKGPMYKIKSKFIDLLVTPNHKMYIAKKQRDGTWKFRLEEAQQIYSKTVKYLKAAKWKGIYPEYFILPPVEVKRTEGRQNPPYTYKKFREPRKIKIEDWVRFLGYWLSEGYIDHNPNYSRSKYEAGNYTVGIRQKNPELLKKMGEALQKVTSGKVYYYEDKVIVRDKQLWNYLRQFGYCSEKFIPKEIKTLAPELLQIFLKSYWEGDGCKNSHRIVTSSSKMKDDLQEVIIKAGFASDFVERKPGATYIRGRKIVPKHNIYVLSFNSWNTEPIVNKRNKQDSFVEYIGKVYCVEVPNHILLVRRNGKAVFSGNSGYGKVTRYVTNLLSQNGYRVIISAYYGVEPGQQIMLNPNLIMVGSKIGSFGVQSSKMYADMFKTDVSILCTDWWAFPDFPRLHPTAILHSPQDSEEYDPGTYEMTKLYFSVTTFTEWAKRDFEKHGIKVDTIIPHGVDTSIFRPLDKKECRKHFGFPEDKFIFGMVSANNDKEDRKNWSGTLRAFRHLLDQDPDIGKDCRLVLFTDPNNPAGYPITAIVNKLKLQDYVYLFPSHIFNVGISEHELNILYNCFDVHTLCSKREGFGLTILESMCAGIPNIVHNYSCLDEATRILTTDGLKSFQQIKIGDRVFALDRFGYIKEVPVTNVFIYDYSGEMIRIKNKQIDLKVTPNHRIYLREETSPILAEKLLHLSSEARRHIPIKGKWNGLTNEYIEVPKILKITNTKILPNKIPTKVFLKLLGWYIAEGCLEKDKCKEYNLIKFSTPKEDEQQEIAGLLTSIGLKPIKCKNTFSGVKVYSKQLALMFKEAGRNAFEKRIPLWILSLDSSLLKFLFETLMKGDGNKNGNCYTTVSPSLRDSFCELLLKIGFSPVVWIEKPRISYIKTRKIISRPTFYIGIRKQGLGTIRGKDVTKEFYTGKVWCISTPLQNFLCERNGRFAFVGNSMPELVEGRGWLVKSLTSGINRVITPINSEFHIPDTYDLYEKMKRAYQRTEEREKYSILARKFALQFDWNLIFKEKWTPYLRQIEEKLKKHPSSVIGVSEKKDELFKSKYQEVV